MELEILGFALTVARKSQGKSLKSSAMINADGVIGIRLIQHMPQWSKGYDNALSQH